MAKTLKSLWWGVWSVANGDTTYVFLLVKANSKEEAEIIAENRLMARGWMSDPVATAHPATEQDFCRWRRRDLVSYDGRPA